MANVNLVLASASPRRSDLLRLVVSTFDVLPSLVEETGSDAEPNVPLQPLVLPSGFSIPSQADPRLWAWRKAVDVALAGGPPVLDAALLGADTVVVSGERVLGKPRDLVEAREMLRLLRGSYHYVVTGYAILLKTHENVELQAIEAVITRVEMRQFSDDELEGYVISGEPLDKAGAYALQGAGRTLVASVDGCATNVIGLPLCAIRATLQESAVSVFPYPEAGYCAACPANGGISR